MANRRSTRNCVTIRICVDDDVDKKIIKYQASKIAKTGMNYTKPEATYDLFREALKGAKLL